MRRANLSRPESSAATISACSSFTRLKSLRWRLASMFAASSATRSLLLLCLFRYAFVILPRGIAVALYIACSPTSSSSCSARSSTFPQSKSLINHALASVLTSGAFIGSSCLLSILDTSRATSFASTACRASSGGL